MSGTVNSTIELGAKDNKRLIAYQQSGKQSSDGKPAIFWLNGFRSNMSSQKATQVQQWAKQNQLAMTCFDYSGHGESSGDFKDGTIGQWLEEAQHLFDTLTKGPQILVGSSMGGWMALLLLQSYLKSLKEGETSRISGIALIAPAFNMTHDLIWKRMDDEIRAIIEKDGFWMKPASKDEAEFPITQHFIREGEYHQINAVFRSHCPVRIIQGMQDEIVPWQHSMKLMRHIDEDDMDYLLVKDAGHRLSRPEDIKRLIQLIKEMV